MGGRIGGAKENGLARAASIAGAIVLAAAWIYAYVCSGTLGRLVGEWTASGMRYHGLAVLAAALLLFNRGGRRESSEAASWSSFLMALLPLSLAAALLAVGGGGRREGMEFLSLWLSLAGLTVLFGGLRGLGFPLCILLFALPVPDVAQAGITSTLQEWASRLGLGGMRLAGIAAVAESGTAGAPGWIDAGFARWTLAEACGGLKFAAPLLMCAFIVGYLFCRTLPKQIAVVLLSLPMLAAASGTRLAVAGVMGAHLGPLWAERAFHWLPPVTVPFVALLGVLLLALCLRPFGIPGEDRVIVRDLGVAASSFGLDRKPSMRWLHFLVVALFLASAAFYAGPLRAISEPVHRPLSSLPDRLNDWVRVEDGREALASGTMLQAAYRNESSGRTIVLAVAYRGAWPGVFGLRAPETPLLGNGVPTAGEGMDGFPGRRLLFSDGHARFLENYWFQGRGILTASILEIRLAACFDALTIRRVDGALVRMEAEVPGEPAETQAALDSFRDGLLPVLSDLVPD